MKRDRAGYTLIEIMTAVVIMTIGATGILAMQGASVHSNQDAAETTTAVTFATTWMERLKRDARMWIAQGATALSATPGPRYLGMAISNQNTWFVPASTANESAAADFSGFDTMNVNLIRYCVNVRLTVLHAFNPVTFGTDAITDTDAVRADLVVWWHRAADQVNRATPVCAPAGANAIAPALPNAPRIRRQYLSTVVSWREPGWR